jgi:hypothetical protein
MAIQIGKYKRPGIFQEEYDNSIIASPIVEGITNMVIGVSKKGPVNTPIRLTNPNDLESIFGQLDRGLERKGSFFHRTIQKMLETAPVYAINLLQTDDTLDTIEYKSISTSSGYTNDIKRDGPYRRFFDTTGFWSRDTESFINLTSDNVGYEEKAFSLTNLSDKYITVFIVKSSRTGFDRTLIEWYGSTEKLPPYVNANDYASDYMVDVVIVGGDWSNYQELAINTRWSAYFNSSGLIKTQLRNFANDRNVTLLAYYDGLSLIPYFRDSAGNNIFIETTINRDTDKTGLFCAFNNDLVETDYYNGLLDIIGNTIADVNEAGIEFISYKETIAETITIEQTPLDLPGNVTAMLGSSNATYSYVSQDTKNPHAFGTPSTSGTGIVENEHRSAYYGEGSVFGLKLGTVGGGLSGGKIYEIEYEKTDYGAFGMIGDTIIPISATISTLTINGDDYPSSSATYSYVSAFVLNTQGVISIVNGTTPFYNPTSARIGISDLNPIVNTSDIVLGYCEFIVSAATKYIIIAAGNAVNDVSVTTSGFNDFSYGTNSTSNDYYIATQSSTSIKVEFRNTTGTTPTTKEYEKYRRFKMFNRLVDLISSANKDKMTLCLGPSNSYEKYSMSNVSISSIVTSTLQNKSFILSGLPSTKLSDIVKGYFVIYTEDNEFILGSAGESLGFTTQNETAGNGILGASYGVVSTYSKFYTDFYDGIINTGDYFYNNFLSGTLTDVIFISGEDAVPGSATYSGYDYVIFDLDMNFDIYAQFIVPASTLNTGSFTVVDNSNPSALAIALDYTGKYAYRVNENVVYEEIFDVTEIYDYLDKIYLKIYLDNNGLLDVKLTDSEYSPITPINITSNNTIFIQSAKSNFKQTIEVELPDGYVQVPNKILINSARYTEVKVGDFLSAYYDVTTLETGEVPRKLTRILSKRQYSGDTSLVEISCDARIATTSFSGDLQTTRYTSIDNYVSTYKALTFRGFRIREASLPSGTEARQTEILNLVAKGTPLFKAITNKEAIDFRYLIDSFGLGLIEKSKQQLVDICGERLDALGIINMPSMKSFKNSSSPTFVNSEGVLQTEFIAQGGDPESSPAFLYSFGDGAGSSAVGFFCPYLTVNDNGRPVNVPPAAWVATTYMRKHISNISGMTPWTISAGVTNGRITNITATEMDFTNTDIENLNGAEMNPIVFKRNRGNVIETENTAQTLYKSALSYLHVREVLIELERELSRMLLDFQWKYNTPDIRAEIKLRADVICETYVSKNGLYNYFNKMDEENNTSEVIDNQMGILDTYVEPIKGMGIIVNNITILRTGAIAAGGFING